MTKFLRPTNIDRRGAEISCFFFLRLPYGQYGPVSQLSRKKKKKKRIPRFLGGCCLGARWLCWLFLCFASLSLPKVASHGDDVGDNSWLKWQSTLLTVLRHSWICRRHRIGQTILVPFCSAMAIKGEVHVKSMVWAPKITLNDGRYVIRPFECKIVGTAEGLARASIHTFFALFDDEEWRIITLFVNHLDSKTKYTDLFAASCGSIGDFTDIKLGDEGYAVTRQMKHFNLPVRNLDGTFYAQVHPFDPSYFAVKVHPSGALLFTPHHSLLTLIQHLIIQSPASPVPC